MSLRDFHLDISNIQHHRKLQITAISGRPWMLINEVISIGFVHTKDGQDEGLPGLHPAPIRLRIDVFNPPHGLSVRHLSKVNLCR